MEGSHDYFFFGHAPLQHSVLGFDDPPVIERVDLDEPGPQTVPRRKYASAQCAVGIRDVSLDHPGDDSQIFLIFEREELDHRLVAVRIKVTGLIEDKGDTTGHTGCKVTAGRPQHHHTAPGHVLTAVIAHCLDHRLQAAIADTEPLSRDPSDIGFASGGSVEGHVADNDILFCQEPGLRGWMDDYLSSRESLPDVVVGVAFQGHRHPRRNKGSEALAGGALEVESDGVLEQSLRAVAPSHLASHSGSHHPIVVSYGKRCLDRFC